MKKITKILAFIVILIIIHTIAFYFIFINNQNTLFYEQYDYRTLEIIKLTQPADSVKVVYETEDFIFSFGLNDFVSYLNTSTNESESECINKSQELISSIMKEAQINDTIIINETTFRFGYSSCGKNFFKNFDEVERFSLLDTGIFSLFYKENNTYIDKIIYEEGSYYYDILWAGGYMIYVLENGCTVYSIYRWMS